MIIPMAAEAGTLLVILTAFALSTISESYLITLSPRKVALVAGKWRTNFTCTVNPSSSRRPMHTLHMYLSSANLTFQFTSQLARNDAYTIPDSCTRRVNDRTLEMSHCPLVDEKRSTDDADWLACLLIHDNSTYDEAYVTIKDQHSKPQIFEPEIYNWDKLSFLVETNENQSRMFSMNYAAWIWNNSSTSPTVQNCSIARINATVLKATVEHPFRISHPSDCLIIKVNGSTEHGDTKEIIETVSSDQVMIVLNHFVKPAQVKNIEVLHLESSVTLSFEPPKFNRNITYNVVVKCKKDFNNHTVNVTREINCPPNNGTRQSNNNNGTHCRVSKEFTDLPAFSSCTASVRGVPVAGGRWSDWKRHDFETPEGIPRRNPEICSSCFSIRQGISHLESEVIVYFTPLSEEEAQGKIVLYRIRIYDKSLLKENFQYLNNTEKSHHSFVLRNLPHNTDYEIGMEAKTSKGYYSESPNISKAIGVSLSHVLSLSYLKNFVVVLLNDTTVRTSWDINETYCGTEMKLSVYWCEGHFRDKTCSNVLKWKSISSDVTSSIITFSGDESIFGIGVECDGKSSGILWNKCLYDIGKSPSEPYIHAILPFDSGAKIVLGNNSRCSSTGSGPGLTVAYRISYCQILRDLSSNVDRNCVGSWTTLTLERFADSLIVSGLNQSHRYRLSIQSLSENNMSSLEVIRFIDLFPVVRPISDNNNSSSSFKSHVLIFAVLATLAVVIAIAVVVYCRYYVKSEIPVAQPVAVKGVKSVTMRVERSVNREIDPYAVLVIKNSTPQPVESGDSPQPETQNLTFDPEDFVDTEEEEDNLLPSMAEVMSIFPNRFNHIIYPGTQGGPEPLLVIQATPFPKTSQSGGRQFEADTSRILPSVFGSPSDNNTAIKTDAKVSVDELQCQQMTLCEHREPSTAAYSPPASDYVSDNDEYMCVAHGNPESSKSVKASACEDSGSGYIDGSARLLLAMQPPPSGPAQAITDESIDDGQNISSPPSAIEESHRAILISSSEDNDEDAIEDYIESLVACQSASISDSPNDNTMITEEAFLKEYFLSPNKDAAMKISAESSRSEYWPSMADEGLGLSEDVEEGKASVLRPALADEYYSGMRQDHRHVHQGSEETSDEAEEFNLEPTFSSEEEKEYDFSPDPSIPPVRYCSDLIMEFEDYRSTPTSILPSILLT